MAFSKSNDYPRKLAIVSAYAKLIAHPARVTLLLQLQQGSATLAQLAEDHPLSMVSVSNHLRALLRANLIQVHDNNQKATYTTLPNEWPIIVEYAVKQATRENQFSTAA